MRFKLSYKIFATLTLTSLLVVALLVGLIRFYVARNFADYVNRSLLERYSEVADALAAEVVERRPGTRIYRVTGADTYVPLGAAANLVLVQEADIRAGIEHICGGEA